MPSAVVGRQCPALSPTKKMPSPVAGRIWCGIQLPCQRSAGTPTSAARRSVGSARGRAGRTSRRRRAARRPPGTTRSTRRGRSGGPATARGRRPCGVRVDLQAARQARLGRLDALVGVEHAAPAERVDDERRAQIAAVRVDDVARRARRPSRSRTAASHAAEQQLAQAPVVEGRERERQLPAERPRRARGRRGRRTSAGSRRPARVLAATRSARRMRRSGARRPRSDRP